MFSPIEDNQVLFLAGGILGGDTGEIFCLIEVCYGF